MLSSLEIATYSFFTDVGTVKAVDGIDFDVGGKQSVLSVNPAVAIGYKFIYYAALQRPQGQVVEGEIRLNLGDKVMTLQKLLNIVQTLRGNYMSMIFRTDDKS